MRTVGLYGQDCTVRTVRLCLCGSQGRAYPIGRVSVRGTAKVDLSHRKQECNGVVQRVTSLLRKPAILQKMAVDICVSFFLHWWNVLFQWILYSFYPVLRIPIEKQIVSDLWNSARNFIWCAQQNHLFIVWVKSLKKKKLTGYFAVWSIFKWSYLRL